MIEVEVFDLSSRILLEDQNGGEGSDPLHLPPGPPDRLPGRRPREIVAEAPSLAELRRLCILTAASAGIHDGHLAIEFVDAQRIATLNAEHRGEPRPTDVLSFPIDGVAQPAEPIDGVEPPAEPIGGVEPPAGPGPVAAPEPGVECGEIQRDAIDCGARELGDVVICPEQTVDVREAVVHGVLHLVGMDHESDDGEMLALQRELLARENE
jgi:probable rRNA maturation factor